MEYQIQTSMLKPVGNNAGINWDKLPKNLMPKLPDNVKNYLPRTIFYGQLPYHDDPVGIYYLTLPNSRQFFTIQSGFLNALNVKGELKINANTIDTLTVKLWDMVYDLSLKNQKYMYKEIPSKKMSISCGKRMFIDSPSVATFNKLRNENWVKDSPLEEITFTGNSFICTLNCFKNLKKVSFIQKELDVDSSQTFRFGDCPNLKEIDISSLKDFRWVFGIDFEKIPDECIIKINPAFLSNLNFLEITNKSKKRFSCSFSKKQSEPSEYWPLGYVEKLDIRDDLEKFKDMSSPLSINIKQIKEYILNLSKQAKHKAVLDKNKKRKEIQKQVRMNYKY